MTENDIDPILRSLDLPPGTPVEKVVSMIDRLLKDNEAAAAGIELISHTCALFDALVETIADRVAAKLNEDEDPDTEE